MNCLECQELLQRRLDGDQVPGSLALDQHLAGCSSCRRTHAAGALMLEGLKVLSPAPQPRADFAQVMVGKVLRDRQHRRARMRRRMWVTAGLAAAILIMVWAGNIWLPRRDLSNPPPLVAGVTPPANAGGSLAPPANAGGPVTPPADAGGSLAKSMDEARDNVIALTSRLADQTKDQVGLFVSFPAEMPVFAGDARLPMEEPLEQSLLQAGQGVGEGLSTVSRNARRAVSFFTKELPVLENAN